MLDNNGNEIYEQANCNDFVMDAYTEYGQHVNGSGKSFIEGYQEGRMFLDILDGLKISYRHGLQALWEAPNKFTKTVAIVGDELKKYHFTGDASVPDVLYSLVNDYKCVEIQGESGSRTMTVSAPPAACRYTELMLKPAVRDQLDKLMPYVPSQTTITGYQEKRFIATPIPLGLVAGSNKCMGIGIANTIPAFTATSMLEAYLANDYTKLKMNFGYSLGHCFNPDLWYDNNTNKVIKDDGKGNWVETDGLDKVDDILDYNDTELKNLWEEGKGSLQMGIPMYYCEINNTTGIMCVCDPKWFTVSISNKITEWEQEGYVEHFDLSADGIGKMFFRITDGTRKVKLEELKDELWWSCIYGRKTSYVLNIAVNGTTGRVALKEWIDFTYKNYSRLYQNYINHELDNLNFMEKVWNNFIFVADKLVHYKKSEMSDEDIVKACNADPVQKKLYKQHPEFKCDLDVVKYVGFKTFNFLRSDVDIADRIQKIHDQRDYFNNINIDDEIVAFVECWDNL